jgi:hypothetical protein
MGDIVDEFIKNLKESIDILFGSDKKEEKQENQNNDQNQDQEITQEDVNKDEDDKPGEFEPLIGPLGF